MKKNYFSLLFILTSIFLFAQNNDFTNGGGDLLWSNPNNWSLGSIPNTSQTIRSSITGSIVDADFTLFKIQNTFGTANSISFGGGGSGTLTINPGGANLLGIVNVSDSDVTLSFSGNVSINNPAGITWMRNENGNTNDLNNIEFEDGSVLTLITNLESRSGTGGDIFNFNGALVGAGSLRIGAGSTCVFGSTSDNSGFEGDFVFVGANGAIVVNTADNIIFLPSGRKFQVNQNNVSAEVNGANVIQGNIVVGGANTFTFDANKNQSSMGTIGIPASGILNLNIDNSVTNLSFSNSSEVAWGTGTLNITNFNEGVVRFGTDNTGLTSQQLSQITADGIAAGEPLGLDNDGYLVLASTLSTNDFEVDAVTRITYPTLTENKLFFRMPQQGIKIFDLSGKMVIENQSQSQTEIEVNTLSKGLYFIVFDNKIVEKFIKQ